MLNEKAVSFIQFESKQEKQSSNKIEINLDDIKSFSKYCYDLTNNQNFNFCPNCSFNNTKNDYKFCTYSGTD